MTASNLPMHPTGSSQWLASTIETALEPDLEIVDPHYHLWGPPRGRYLHEEFTADVGSGHKVVSSVFAECSEAYRTEGPEAMRSVGETEFVANLASKHPHQPGECRHHEGIIGWADLSIGRDIRPSLEAHVEAGGGRFRGVRLSTAWDPNPEVRTTIRTPPQGLLRDAKFRKGFEELISMGLSFDAWVYFHQLDDVADLARAYPEASIVLDHVGGPIGVGPYAAKRSEVFRHWSDGIDDVASCPNVSVKLGGMAMKLAGFDYHKRAAPPTSAQMAEDWHLYMNRCIQAFGPSRAMFESNFPVDQLSCSYVLLWNAFKRVAQTYSAKDKADLFSRTAARVYRLDLSEINQTGRYQ